LRVCSPFFFVTILSPEIATSINIHVPFFHYHGLWCPVYC
jgi:hypothetical protein